GKPDALTAVDVTRAEKSSGTLQVFPGYCIGTNFDVEFSGNGGYTGYEIRLWKSVNDGPFQPGEAKPYDAHQQFWETNNPVPEKRRYHFLITPPAGTYCGRVASTDTVTVHIGQLNAPVVIPHLNGITVAQQEPDATYLWEIQQGALWNTVDGAATGLVFQPRQSGTYRVVAFKHGCREESLPFAFVSTSLGTDPAGAAGITLLANPSSGRFRLKGLKLSDRWQSLVVLGTDGRRVATITDLRGRTGVDADLSYLPSGLYFFVLYRENGGSVHGKWRKQ
ncbi:MAG TPA: hypothetical protein VHK69_02075, partial [Chitinophagaceae bacterium]|nr:hypothetical protein [Chitinophagaceae bacterium]